MNKAIMATIPALLLLSAAAIVAPAQAQLSNIGVVEHRLYIVCANGQQGTPATSVFQLPAPIGSFTGFICTESNPIVSVLMQTWVLLYSNDYTVTGSTFGTPTIKVLARDGTFKSVSGSGGPVFERVNPGSNTVWRLYQAQISMSALQNAIGSGSSDFKGELRYTSPAFSFNTNKGKFDVPSATTTWKGLTHEGTTSGGAVGGGEKPSGKFFYNIAVERLDGATFTYTSADIKNFPPLSVSVLGDGQEFRSITYSLKMLVDNDIWNINQVPKFDNQAAIGNWQAWVQNTPVAKVSDCTPEKAVAGNSASGAAVYRICTMKVLASDIEPMLPVVGQAGNEELRQGTLKFTFNHAKIEFRSTSGTYLVDLPAQTVNVNLGGYTPITIDDEPGECDIVNGETQCGQGSVDMNTIIIGSGIAAVLIGIGIAIAKKKK